MQRSAMWFAVACVAAALLLAAALPGLAFARDFVDTEAECSLALEGAPADVEGGVSFSLFCVADVSQSGDEYALSGDFAAYAGVVAFDAQGQDRGSWRDLAQTLAGFAARDGVKPAAQGTAASGTLSFEGLSAGLYLVVGEPCVGSSLSYTFAPFLVQLPGLVEAADSESGSDEWVYHVSAELKYGSDEVVNAEVSALKVWDDGDSSSRPSAVSVQLLRDGEAYGEAVELNQERNWRFTWSDLEPGHDWRVVEVNVPEGYVTSTSFAEGVFTITNTATTTPPGGGTPTDPSMPTPPGGTPDVPPTTLPQTGQLWWPVPVLTAAGLALILAGLLRRRKVARLQSRSGRFVA